MDTTEANYRQARIAHWDSLAQNMAGQIGWGGYYHQRLTEIYQFLVAPGQRVLEIGCGRGDLLAALKPTAGVGIDFSDEMIQRAKQRHPDLQFIQVDGHQLTETHQFTADQKFDVIIMSDLINDVWDVQTIFQQVADLAAPNTRLIINTYSRLWESPLALAERLGLAKPTLYQNWLTIEDTAGLLNLVDFEVIQTWQEILWPLPTPLLSNFCNRFLVKLWPFKYLGLANFIVARPHPQPQSTKPSVSVIVPARNEAGNIPQILSRVPKMGCRTELVFVEGHSSDHTYEAIEQAISKPTQHPCKLFRQTGEGKGDAVRLGFAQAEGDILMILDADLTVPPEDLPRYYEALRSGKGEFVNGVRLVYPMEKEAMRFFNLLGNKFFSLAFSWLLSQPIKDTLCGTKVLRKRDYERITANRSYFGDFDPFGDFDLLFGAAKLGLKIVDLPIRYRERSYGDTNIQRWKHGWLLLRMVFFAASRIKFV